jgi:hypothetical protein
VTKESQLRAFRYFDKGNLADVGKNFARVAERARHD